MTDKKNFKEKVILLGLKYNQITKEIIFIYPNGKEKIIENNFASKPVYSPSGKQVAFISPLEWETIGKIYNFDLNTQEKTMLAEFDDEKLAPKDVVWLDEENLVVILGMLLARLQ